MMSTHSRSRALRRSLRGHGAPVMCSLLASPVPSAAQNRPGYMAARVPMAWATIAGGYADTRDSGAVAHRLVDPGAATARGALADGPRRHLGHDLLGEPVQQRQRTGHHAAGAVDVLQAGPDRPGVVDDLGDQPVAR